MQAAVILTVKPAFFIVIEELPSQVGRRKLMGDIMPSAQHHP